MRKKSMMLRVRKRADDLVLAIPLAVAAKVGIGECSEVGISWKEGAIIVRPRPRTMSLSRLLSKVTDENIHHEVDPGLPVGNETW